MTFQIRSISIYNSDGRMRTVPFQLGKLNIITGDSRRGKSTLLDVVDYCMASTSYGIKGVVPRNFVHVFAVTLVKDQQQLFVARPAPTRNAATTTTMCIVTQILGATAPSLEELSFTTPVDIGKAILSEFADIDRTVQIPTVGKNPLTAPSVRHALFFCMQKQNEIANPDLLFHSQGEEFRSGTIRAVLPYFLGAFDPEQARLENRLRQLRRQLTQMEAEIAAAERFSPASGQALALLVEAVEVGLLEPLPHTTTADSEVVEYLRRAIAFDAPNFEPETGNDPVAALVDQRGELRALHGQARTRIANLKRVARENNDFLGQAAEQHARLATIGLLDQTGPSDASLNPHCPVCDSHLPELTQIAATIHGDLRQLNADITVITRNNPEIDALITREEDSLEEIRDALRRNQDQIDTLTAGQRATQIQEGAFRRAALVQGRISLYLETVGNQFQMPAVVDRRDEIRTEIGELQEALGSQARDDRLTSFISRINTQIMNKAVTLALEGRESPIRLDPRGLTVVADTTRGPIRLKEMGSAANIIGYHIAVLLSMHEWFSENHCPVPRFLILDQPSQAYFPADKPRDSTLTDEDRAELLNLYSAIQNTVLALGGNFQVIALEHADLDEEPFRSAVEDRWRISNGNALVPQDWITEEINDV